MEHLAFDLLCRLADGEVNQSEKMSAAAHLKSCRACRRELELQQLLIKTSKQAALLNPSPEFTRSVIERINPSQKKRWVQWFIQNLGNIIAMTLVLGFLGYIFTVTHTPALPNDKPSKIEPIFGVVKIIQDGSSQFGNFIASKVVSRGAEVTHTHHTIFFGLLAMILLVFIDHIAGHFFQKSKI